LSGNEPYDDPMEQAIALLEGGYARQAAEHLLTSLMRGKGGLGARLLLVRALIASSDPSRALAEAREIALSNPQIADGALALGEALAANRLLPTAIAEFQRALRLDPGLDAARIALARAWLDAGEPDRAEDALANIEATPSRDALLSQAQAMRGRARSDPGYVRHLFDQFSSDYDERMLGQLGYAAPEILRELANLVLPGRTDLMMLDLGCGTGLAARAFSDLAARIDGIDLSPAMVEKARGRNLYAELSVGDIETLTDERRYDLVVAADTLVYLGDLSKVMSGVSRALTQQGFFLFTVESGPDDGYSLGPKRRWRHSESYLRTLASEHGFDVAGLMACAPRTEAGQPVDGLAVAFEKASGPR
jgi:predicted TPR repeat methyltransferase